MLLYRKMIVASFAAAALLLPAAVSLAQPSPPVAPAPPGPRLNLTEAQRNEIRGVRETQRKEAQALREKMRAARRQLQQAMRAEVPDEAAIRSAAEALGALQADQAVLQARARSQFMQQLTPEQQAQVKQTRERAAARAERQMLQRNRMMRQQYLRWWRGWI
ncbi:MAG: periplasmic heavy metal sensor [Vicinamibacterales bacterium]